MDNIENLWYDRGYIKGRHDLIHELNNEGGCDRMECGCDECKDKRCCKF